MDDPDEGAEQPAGEEPAAPISIEILGDPEKLKLAKGLGKSFDFKLPAGLGKGVDFPAFAKADRLTKKFLDQQAGLALVTRDLAKEREESIKRMVALVDGPGSPQRAQAERELRGLDLQQQLVDAQKQLLEQQIRQSLDSEKDRRIQYAVLVIAVLGITTTLVVAVAVATSSWVWSLLAGVGSTIALALLALLVMSEREPKE